MARASRSSPERREPSAPQAWVAQRQQPVAERALAYATQRRSARARRRRTPATRVGIAYPLDETLTWLVTTARSATHHAFIRTTIRKLIAVFRLSSRESRFAIYSINGCSSVSG